jgi:predicted transposase YdaD
VPWGDFDEATQSVYRTLIYNALGEAMRKKIEEMIMQRVPEFQEPPFVQKLKAIGREEGRAEGLEKGEALGLKGALLKHIERAGLVLGDEERARIEACNDPVLLDRWLDNAFTAKTSADLFREESAAK